MDAAPSPPTPARLHQAIVEQTCEAIVYADRDGVIRIWNRGAEALFGFTAVQAAGASLDLIIPERFRAAHWRGYRDAIAAGRTRHPGQIRTTRALHADGRRLYVDMSFDVIVAADGNASGALAIARDVTARHLEKAAPPVSTHDRKETPS